MSEGAVGSAAARDPLSPRELAEQIAAGDTTAEATFVERYRPSVLLLARHRLGACSQAEDVCHETLRIALEGLRAGRLRQHDQLASYLWGIAAKVVRRNQRWFARHLGDDDIEHVRDDAADPERPLLAAELRRLVREVLMQLSPKDRELIASFYLRDLDKADVCRQLALTSRQFDMTKFRALKRFAQVWQKTQGVASFADESPDG